MKLLRGLVIGLLVLGSLWLQLPAWSQNPLSPKARPALYEFGAGYCYSCKVMEQVMAELKKSHGDQVEFRMVYTDKEQDLFKQYKIMLIPTQVFLNAEGKEVDRHIGPLTKEEVLQKLKELKLIK
jgi:thioredoxin 1